METEQNQDFTTLWNAQLRNHQSRLKLDFALGWHIVKQQQNLAELPYTIAVLRLTVEGLINYLSKVSLHSRQEIESSIAEYLDKKSAHNEALFRDRELHLAREVLKKQSAELQATEAAP